MLIFGNAFKEAKLTQYWTIRFCLIILLSRTNNKLCCSLLSPFYLRQQEQEQAYFTRNNKWVIYNSNKKFIPLCRIKHCRIKREFYEHFWDNNRNYRSLFVLILLENTSLPHFHKPHLSACLQEKTKQKQPRESS